MSEIRPVSVPSFSEYVAAAFLRDEPTGAFVTISPELLSVAVNGRLRARADAVLAGSGQLRITPASRFAIPSGAAADYGPLAAVDGRGRVLIGDGGKRVTLLALRADEALVVAPHAVLAVEDTVRCAAASVRLPLEKPKEWPAVRVAGPGRLAFGSHGEPYPVRVTPQSPLFVRTGAALVWSAGLSVSGRAGSTGDARVAFSGDGFVFVQGSAD